VVHDTIIRESSVKLQQSMGTGVSRPFLAKARGGGEEKWGAVKNARKRAQVFGLKAPDARVADRSV
jgi:hypothetical protein